MPSDNNLHKAAHKGDLDECKKLIETPDEGEDPIDVNEPGASERRPLHRAAGAGHTELCEYFLQKGAELDAVDKSGRTALIWAAISGYAEVAKLLLGKGSNILAVTSAGMNALHGACEGGRVEVVRCLMDNVGSNPDRKTALTMAKNSDNKTPWEIAFGAKNSAICGILKEMGDANGASASCVIS